MNSLPLEKHIYPLNILRNTFVVMEVLVIVWKKEVNYWRIYLPILAHGIIHRISQFMNKRLFDQTAYHIT